MFNNRPRVHCGGMVRRNSFLFGDWSRKRARSRYPASSIVLLLRLGGDAVRRERGSAEAKVVIADGKGGVER